MTRPHCSVDLVAAQRWNLDDVRLLTALGVLEANAHSERYPSRHFLIWQAGACSARLHTAHDHES